MFETMLTVIVMIIDAAWASCRTGLNGGPENSDTCAIPEDDHLSQRKVLLLYAIQDSWY